jgi:Uma2 family endonuclease
MSIEILSPGTRRRDKGRKRAVYDREGVREYWIVDPESRSMATLRRKHAEAGLTDVTTATFEAADVLESPLFPGLRIPLCEVFRRG